MERKELLKILVVVSGFKIRKILPKKKNGNLIRKAIDRIKDEGEVFGAEKKRLRDV